MQLDTSAYPFENFGLQRFTGLEVSTPLKLEVDFKQVVTSIPENHFTKGFLFPRLVTAIGRQRWEEVQGKLLSPPPRARYLPFIDYPMRDYGHLVWEAVQRAGGEVSSGERCLRCARDDIRSFAQSSFGRVMLAMGVNPVRAMKGMPAIFKHSTSDTRIKATRVGDACVKLDWFEFHGAWPYALGQIEGIVMDFGGNTKIDVEVSGVGQFSFLIKIA